MTAIRIVVMLSVLAWTWTAHAGSYTITTTPEQDQALAAIASNQTANVQRVAAKSGSTQAATTPQQLVQRTMDHYLSAEVARIKRESACAKVTDAQAKQALGCKP